MKITLFLIFQMVSLHLVYPQLHVAMTLDDVPNTIEYERNDFRSILLETLDSLAIPIAIFINEEQIYKTASRQKNINLLGEWISRDYVTIGNHTYGHSRYSSAGYDTFIVDVKKGEKLSGKIGEKYQKKLHFFRFPYNDLGIDSVSHVRISNFLNERGYQITPFTIESSDWMFNRFYINYIQDRKEDKAKDIGELYIEKTLEYFEYFEKLSIEKYHRPIKQIYLCHDNKLNADYIEELVEQLIKKGYQFISLDEALEDEIYEQRDEYNMKWGVSWFYRWEKSKSERKRLMLAEPSLDKIEEK